MARERGPRRPRDLMPFIVLAAIILVALAGWLIFPAVQRSLSNQDCIAAGPLRAWPWIEGVLRWVGAAYLLWLAWHIAMARPEMDSAHLEANRRRPLTFVQAAMFQWVNPKAWIIAVNAIVTYTSASRGSLAAQALALAGTFLIVTLPTTLLWASVGVGAARLLRTPSLLRTFNVVLAALLVASLLPLLRGE